MTDKPNTKKELLTVNNIRMNNAVNILTHLVKEENLTRSDLAAENRISIMTVKHIVDGLITMGIVEEHTSATAVGRKPMALNISQKYGNIVCINLTETDEIRYIIYDIKRTVLEEKCLRFHKSAKPYKENLLLVIDQIGATLRSLPTVNVGMAVFVPSAYYAEKDLVNYDLIGAFKDLHIKALFQEKLGIDNIWILHDAFSAAKSEYESADSAVDGQFYFYCGTGVGGFFIHKGRPVMGENLVAGEVGKMIVSTDPVTGVRTTLEKEVAVPGLMEKLSVLSPESDFEAALEAYEKGNSEMASVIERALEISASVLYNIMWIYNPTTIVVDSNYAAYSALIKKKTEECFEKWKEKAIPIGVEIRQAQYDEYHMMRGCFKLVSEKWIEEIAKKQFASPTEAQEVG